MSDALETAVKAAGAKFPQLTSEMAQAVIDAYVKARGPVYLNQREKYDLASKIRVEHRSETDVVQDVFDEVAVMFHVWRRG